MCLSMQYSSANLTLPHTITDHKNAMNIRYKPPYPQTFQFLFEISVLVICTYFCYLMTNFAWFSPCHSDLWWLNQGYLFISIIHWPDDQTQLRKVLCSLSSRWQYPKWMSFLSLRRPKLHHLTALLCHLRRRRNPLKTHLDCISFWRRGAKEKDRGAIEYRVEVLYSVSKEGIKEYTTIFALNSPFP